MTLALWQGVCEGTQMHDQYVLFTSGEYSYYGVGGLIVGPAEPPVRELVRVFHHEYLQTREVARRGVWEGVYPRETVRDIESARKRLLAEGVPVVAEANYYGGDDTVYGSAEGLLVAWLVTRHGYRAVAYVECHEGMLRDTQP